MISLFYFIAYKTENSNLQFERTRNSQFHVRKQLKNLYQ